MKTTSKNTASANEQKNNISGLPRSRKKTSGYGGGDVKTIISVDQVIAEVTALSDQVPSEDALETLAYGKKEDASSPTKASFLHFSHVTAGYGKMTILTDFNLFLKQGQSLCLIGPNGAGKSTILHSLYGMTNIFSGKITLKGKDITALPPNEKLRQMGIAYLLQENSVFPDMTVEENLLMGGFLMESKNKAYQEMERILTHYERLHKRRHQKASTLSGGERRLLEISRALMMNPDILLVDEPSIGLEPRFIDMVFEILKDLRDHQHKTILMVEQNAKKGLEFADIGYVLVSGGIVLAGEGRELLKNPHVGRLFLGG